MLHDGPVPAGSAGSCGPSAPPSPRAAGWTTADDALTRLRARDERLDRALAQGEPVVLWFEHDLFDQLQLLQALDAIGDGAATTSSSSSSGRSRAGRASWAWASSARPSCAALAAAVSLRPEQRARARRAWARFRAGDLDALAEEARAPAAGLPYLGAALERLLEDVPGPDGPGRTERELLAAVDRGAATAGAAFTDAAGRDEAPFLGDGSAFARLAAMAAPPRALVEAEEGPIGESTPLRLTAAGRAVLAGRDPWYAPHGLRAMARRRPAGPHCIRERPERVTFAGTRCSSG